MNHEVYYFLLGGFQGGGAQRVCVRLVNKFVENDLKVTLIVMDKCGSLRELVREEVKVISIDKSRVRYAFFEVLKIMRKERPANIISFNFQLAVIAYLSKRVLNLDTKIFLRIINTISSSLGSSLYGMFRKKIRNLFCNKFDSLIFQCNEMKVDFHREIKLRRNVNSVVIYNPAFYNRERVVSNFSENRHNLVFAGRLEKQKNLPLLLESFHWAVKKNDKLKLYLYGEGSEKQRLKQEAMRLGLQHKVFFMDFEVNLSKLFLNKGLSILTSNFEGFPNFLLDSISFGVPIVSVNCKSGPSEIISDVNGILVNEYSSEFLGEAILRAVDKSWNQEEIIRDSQQRFGLSEFYESYYKLLH